MRRVLMPAALGAVMSLALALAPALAQSQQGRLRILRQGQLIGSESYEITATKTEVQSRGELEIQVEGGTIRQTAVQLLSADLTPRQYELRMEKPEKTWRRVEFSGGTATARYPLPDGKEDTQEFKFADGHVTILGLYHDFLLLARRYDLARGGPQTVRVFVPWGLQPGEATLELRSVKTETVDGASQPVREFAITTPDSQLQLWVTESGRLVRLVAPLEGVEILPDMR
jgi:hypothetical protein